MGGIVYVGMAEHGFLSILWNELWNGMTSDDLPLVTICTTVKNRAVSIRRCVESVLSQEYPNIEHVIQDGASTDGTLEILQEYERRYPQRVRLESASDRDGQEAFYRVVRRARGVYLGTCWSDDELLPSAVSWAVNRLEANPEAAAVYGGWYDTDIHGNILAGHVRPPDFELKAYLCHEIVLPFASSFFRTACLNEIGIHEDNWIAGTGEFELWVRLGLRYPILSGYGCVAKYNISSGTNSHTTSILEGLYGPHMQMLAKVFDDPASPPHIRSLRGRAYAGVHLWLAEGLAFSGARARAWNFLLGSLRFRPNLHRFAAVLRVLVKQSLRPVDKAVWMQELPA